MKRYTIRKAYRIDEDTSQLIKENMNREKSGKITESEYIRQLIRRDYIAGIGISKADFDDIKRKLSGIGNNINQIAHRANMEAGDLYDVKKLTEMSADIAAIRETIADMYIIWKKG